MKIYHFDGKHVAAQERLGPPPSSGFTWVLLSRNEFEAQLSDLQNQLEQCTGQRLMQLHVQDIRNAQHPSRYDYANGYDMVIFRKLQLQYGAHEAGEGSAPMHSLLGLQTHPVSLVVFDHLLLTVYDEQAPLAEEFAARFTQDARLPLSAADLMLRIINILVDAYLDLRKVLSANLKFWQGQLLASNTQFTQWKLLLAEREHLNLLEDMCDEQHDAVQEYLDGLMDQPVSSADLNSKVHELLVARSRDILGHIARVRQHVRRLEESIESAVQIHFSAQAHRTNVIMRFLTAITAIFLPLNLVTGFFGMNFEALPWIHKQQGIWYAVLAMVLIATLTSLVFWRKRYLSRSEM